MHEGYPNNSEQIIPEPYTETENPYERFSRLADEHRQQMLDDAREKALADPDKEAFDPAKLEQLLERGELSDSAKEHHEIQYSTNPEVYSTEEYAALCLDIEAGGTR
jgi:hypothetical protein